MRDDPVTVLLTRPEAASRRFAAQLRAAGIEAPVLIAPLLTICPVAGALDEIGARLRDYAGLIFTSVHGVAALAGARGLPRDAWCVGAQTAAAARAAGFAARSAGGDAGALQGLILSAGTAGPLLQVRGRHARGDLAARLTSAGVPTDEVVVYEQAAQALGAEAETLLRGPGAVVAPLFSPRSARLLRASIDRVAEPRARLHVVAISPAAAAAWQGVGSSPGRVAVAERADAPAMTAAVAFRISAAGAA